MEVVGSSMAGLVEIFGTIARSAVEEKAEHKVAVRAGE